MKRTNTIGEREMNEKSKYNRRERNDMNHGHITSLDHLRS